MVFIILFCSLIFSLNKEEKKSSQEYLVEMETIYNGLNDNIITLKQQEPTTETQEKIDLYESSMLALNQTYIGIKNSDWKQVSSQQVNYLKNIKKLMILGEEAPYNINESDIDNQILFFSICFKENIPPLLTKVNMSGFYFFKIVIELINSLLIIGMITLVFFDLFCSELEQNSINLLFTQPYNRKNFFYKKIITALSISSLMIFLFLFFSIVIGRILTGSFGTLKYPIAISGNTIENAKILSLFNYLIIQLLFLFLIILFSILLICFLSLAMRNSIMVLVVSLIVLFLPSIIIEKLALNSTLVTLLPHYFFSVSEKIILNFEKNSLTQFVTKGLLSLSISSLSLFVGIKNIKI